VRTPPRQNWFSWMNKHATYLASKHWADKTRELLTN
jgi:hypothetical protein